MHDDEEPSERLSRPYPDQAQCGFREIVSELRRMVGLMVIIELEDEHTTTVIDFDGVLRAIECSDDEYPVAYCLIDDHFKLSIPKNAILAGVAYPRNVAVALAGGLVLRVYQYDDPPKRRTSRRACESRRDEGRRRAHQGRGDR